MTPSAPPDVIEALRAKPAALSRFEGLAPSHKAEYLKWIDEAKRDETRRRRIAGMIEKLTVGTGVPEAVGRAAPRGALRRSGERTGSRPIGQSAKTRPERGAQ